MNKTIRKRIVKATAPSIGFLLFMLLLPIFWSSMNFVIIALFSYASASKGTNQAIELSNKTTIFLICFLILYFFSVLLSLESIQGLEMFSIWPSAVLIYFILANYCDYRSDWRIICYACSILPIVIFLSYLQPYIQNSHLGVEEIIGEIGNPLFIVPNDFTFLSLIAPFSLALITMSKGNVDKFVGVTSLILTLLTISAAGSRTAVLVFSICLATYLFLYVPRMAKWLIISFIPMLFIIDMLLGFPLISKFSVIPTSRLPLWFAATQSFLENPLFGNGPQSFADYYAYTIANTDFPDWVIVDTRNIPWPHNLYLEILAGSGLFCFLSFMGILLTSVYKLAVLRRNECCQPSAPISLGSSIIGFLAASLVEASFLRIWVLIYLFTMLGIISNVDRILNADANSLNYEN